MAKIRVQQKDGEIVLTTDKARTYAVEDHIVNVTGAANVAAFLAAVPGAEPYDEPEPPQTQNPPRT